jgi:hypothetical protein
MLEFKKNKIPDIGPRCRMDHQSSQEYMNIGSERTSWQEKSSEEGMDSGFQPCTMSLEGMESMAHLKKKHWLPGWCEPGVP